MVGNNAVNRVDYLGLIDSVTMSIPKLAASGMTAAEIAELTGISLSAAIAAEAAARAAQKVKDFTRNARGSDPCEKAKDALRQAQRALENTRKSMEEHRQKAADPLSAITDPVKAANPHYVKGLGEWYQKEVGDMENEIRAIESALKGLEKAVDAACKCWYKPWTWFN